MSAKLSFNLKDVSYYTNIDLENQTIDFSIQNPHKGTQPETLYKYYSINNYSIEGFVNHFLFSAHPMTLNDKYDCAGELIDYSNLSLVNYIDRFSKELKLYSVEKVQELYNSENKWILDRTFADLNHLILFMKFGIISLTEKYDDPLMWAHYSQNSGFVLKLKTTLLPADFFGPFPINYVDNLTKIDFLNYHSALCVLYQSNVKQNIWATENE